jgi:hypothetical protein
MSDRNRKRKRRESRQRRKIGQGRQPRPEERLMALVRTCGTVALSAAWAMVLNDVSGTHAFIGLAVLCAVVAGAVVCIRRGDAGSRISRMGPWVLLALAAGAAIAAAAGTGPWPDLLTAGAVILVTGAALLAACLKKAAQLFGRVALLGLAVTFCKAGTFWLADGNLPVGIALLLVGAAFAATGLVFTAEREALLGTAALSLGLAFDGLAMALHASQSLRVSAILADIGIGIISLGLALLPERDAASYVGIVTAGAIVGGNGVVLLTGRGQALAGSVVLGLGASLIAAGTACLADRRPIGYAAVILTGALIIASGADWHPGLQSLLLATTMVSGLTAILFGVAETDRSTLESWHRWLFKAPGTPPPQTHTKRRR